MNEARRHRTRNQRKRDMARKVFMVLMLMLLWMVLLTMMVKAFATHPAEQPVSGIYYLETIQNGCDS